MPEVAFVSYAGVEAGVARFEVCSGKGAKVRRRYTEFLWLHETLQDGSRFPGKSFFGKKLLCAFERRRAAGLEAWLANVLEQPVGAPLLAFLGRGDASAEGTPELTPEVRDRPRAGTIGTRLREEKAERERAAKAEQEAAEAAKADARRQNLATQTAAREAAKAEAAAAQLTEREAAREAEVNAREARARAQLAARAEAEAAAKAAAAAKLEAEREAILAARRERHQQAVDAEAPASPELAAALAQAARAKGASLAQEARRCRDLEHEQMSASLDARARKPRAEGPVEGPGEAAEA